MILFMHFMEAFEKSLKNSRQVFDAANDLDVKNGGDEFSMNYVLKIFHTYKTRDNSYMRGGTFAFEDMTQFFECIEDCVLNASNLKKLELTANPFAAFNVRNKNYGKQRMLLEICNTVSKDKFGFTLFAIL